MSESNVSKAESFTVETSCVCVSTKDKGGFLRRYTIPNRYIHTTSHGTFVALKPNRCASVAKILAAKIYSDPKESKSNVFFGRVLQAGKC